MKNYRISFYVGTDLRWECVRMAHDEVRALVLALDYMGKPSWVDGVSRIEILHADTAPRDGGAMESDAAYYARHAGK